MTWPRHAASEIAKASGLGRKSLYKTLAPGAKRGFETIMRALNVGFSVDSRLPVMGEEGPEAESGVVASEVANVTHSISSSSFNALPNTS